MGGVGRGEVLELDQRAGEDLLHRLHELVEQRVIGGPSEAWLRQPDVVRVRAKRLVFGPNVQHHRQSQRGIEAATGRVECQFPDRDPHPVRPEIAQSQDPLPVRDHDHPHPALGPVPEDVADATTVARGYVQPPRPSEDETELPACLPHCRRVEDGQQLGQVVHDRPVEEPLIAVEQCHEEQVLVERGVEASQVGQDSMFLLVLGEDPRGQQPSKAEHLSFHVGERRPLVEPRIVQDLHPPARSPVLRMAL